MFKPFKIEMQSDIDVSHLIYPFLTGTNVLVVIRMLQSLRYGDRGYVGMSVVYNAPEDYILGQVG